MNFAKKSCTQKHVCPVLQATLDMMLGLIFEFEFVTIQSSSLIDSAAIAEGPYHIIYLTTLVKSMKNPT